ncbi:MAG TPA: hypothetical protein VIM55_00840 [Mucilaginibacter sp.]
MNKNVHDKIELFKKMAKSSGDSRTTTPVVSEHVDSLAQVIRSKKDAEDFLAELNSVVKR